MKIKTFFSKTIIPFVGKNGAVKPARFFITIFLCLIVTTMIMKLQGKQFISDMLVLGLVGQVSVLIAADTWRSNSKDRRPDYNDEYKYNRNV